MQGLPTLEGIFENFCLNRKGFTRNHDDQGDFSTIRFLMSYCSIKDFSKWLMIKIYLDSL